MLSISGRSHYSGGDNLISVTIASLRLDRPLHVEAIALGDQLDRTRESGARGRQGSVARVGRQDVGQQQPRRSALCRDTSHVAGGDVLGPRRDRARPEGCLG